MDGAQERNAIRATIDRIEAASSTRPVGWLGAGLAETWNTLGYLAEAGIRYVCDWVLCHEHHRSKRRCATVREMKEGPSGSAIRSLIPSHRKLLWSKAMVVSVAETPGR